MNDFNAVMLYILLLIMTLILLKARFRIVYHLLLFS